MLHDARRRTSLHGAYTSLLARAHPPLTAQPGPCRRAWDMPSAPADGQIDGHAVPARGNQAMQRQSERQPATMNCCAKDTAVNACAGRSVWKRWIKRPCCGLHSLRCRSRCPSQPHKVGGWSAAVVALIGSGHARAGLRVRPSARCSLRGRRECARRRLVVRLGRPQQDE